MTRRKFIPLAGLGAGVAYLALRGERQEVIPAGPPGKSAVASGNPNVLKTDLPSYPETTALAMLGLQGRAGHELVLAAERFRAQSKSSLANVWLAIALRCYGASPPISERKLESADVMLCALEALGHAEGNYRLLQVENVGRSAVP